VVNDIASCSPGGRFWLIERYPSTDYSRYVTNAFLNEQSALREIDRQYFEAVMVFLVEPVQQGGADGEATVADRGR
jgi:hypothetical protein